MSVSIRRMCAGPGQQSKTLIHFSKDLYYEWVTTDYEHAEIEKIFLQDRPREGIVNDFSNHFKALYD
jgi:hypothetical protein